MTGRGWSPDPAPLSHPSRPEPSLVAAQNARSPALTGEMEYAASIDKVMQADNKLAAAHAEIKPQAAQADSRGV